MLLRKKCNFSLYLFSVKIRLEIMLNKVWDRKETFFDYRNEIFQSLKKTIFPNWLTHAFGQKIEFFSFFVFGQKGTRNKVEWCFRQKKKLFLTIKTKFFKVSKKKKHFSRGINPCFWTNLDNFFLHLFLVKMRLEILLHKVLDTKETFFDFKNKNFSTSQKWQFSEELNPCFWSKSEMYKFFFCRFGRNKTRNKA